MEKETKDLQKRLKNAKIVLAALGNEIRQDMIVQLASCSPKGLRVSEFKTRCKLSRPSLSHHIKVLYHAKMIEVEHDGTKNYYRLSTNRQVIDEAIGLFDDLKQYDRSLK